MTKQLSDDQIDARFRDWATSVRDTTPPVAMPHYRAVPPQRRRYLAVAAAVVVVVLISVGVTVALQRRTGTPASGSVAPTSGASEVVVGSGHVHDFILRAGDTVQGVGEVLALPGRAVRFCAPRAFADAEDHGADDPEFGYCPAGVDLRGIDLTALAGRTQQAGKIYGYARLTGVYRDHTLTVTNQIATKPAAADLYSNPPCTPPAGGWPTETHGMGTIVDYQRSHPAQVVEIAYLLPSRHRRVPYVVTAGAPGPVRAALTPTYGSDLCVAKSRYTTRQLHNANTEMTSVYLHDESADSLTALTGAGGMDLSKSAQPDVPAEVPAVSPKLAATVDALPRGIVQLQIWLTPAR